jgi:hypothetical protein
VRASIFLTIKNEYFLTWFDWKSVLGSAIGFLPSLWFIFRLVVHCSEGHGH